MRRDLLVLVVGVVAGAVTTGALMLLEDRLDDDAGSGSVGNGVP